MSNSEAFVIPAGLVVSQGQDGLSIEHEGDIILHGTMGMALKQVRSTGGNVELHVDADLGEVSAAGHVVVGGALIVDHLKGERVEVRGGVQARAIDAGTGGALIDGDAQVEQLSAKGDVTVNGNVKATSLSTSAGSLHLNGAVEADTISTAGDLNASGAVTADAVTASGAIRATHGVTARILDGDSVELAGEDLQISVVRAASSISVGSGAIRSDILIAPTVTLAADTTGKITVVESHNELSASAVKGCLSLADLEEFGLDAGAFLEKHGLRPLGDAGNDGAAAGESADQPEEAAPEDEQADTDSGVTVELDDTAELEAEDSAPGDEVIVAVEAALSDEESDTGDTDDLNIEIALSEVDSTDIDNATDDLSAVDLGEPATVSVSVSISDDEDLLGDFELDGADLEIDLDAMEPLEEPSIVQLGEAGEVEDGVEELFGLSIEDGEEEDDIYGQMVETVERIESCYEGAELPPMITLLSEMVEARNYEGIRNDITNIWNQLLKFHQKRGLRIQPQVTTTFNTINKIVREI